MLTLGKSLWKVLVNTILFFFIIIIVSSCNKDKAVEPESKSPFSGISKADSIGKILTSDPDDWKPIKEAGMEFFPEGAFPNPCFAPTGFSLQFRLRAQDSVVITINDTPDHPLRTCLAEKLVPGMYAISVKMGLYDPGIYRLYFKIVRPETTYVSYGDVQIY